MHKTKLLSIGFITLLLLSTIMVVAPGNAVSYPAPAGQAVLWVDPDFINGTEEGGLGNPFTVRVYINVSDTAGPVGDRGMYGFGYWLTWNDTLLTCTMASIDVQIPSDVDPWFWSAGHSTVKNELLDTDTNGVKDTHNYAEVANGVGGGFNGTMWLGEYTFTIAYEPMFPESDLTDLIDITNKGIVDTNGGTIVTTVHDADYVIMSKPAPKPMLEVKDPRDHDHVIERCDFPLDSKFNVSVCIKLLHWGKYLRAFEVKLGFDTTLLNISNVYNGTFMELFGSVFYVNVTHEDLGYLVLAGTFLGDPTKEPGTTPPCAPGYGPAQGVLMNVEFLVTNVSIAPAMYGCEIGLYDTSLVDKDDLPIDHGIQSNLTYLACYTTLGWWLDCFTDEFRKKCETPYVGLGINVTADSYEPQDLVIIHTYLEYNQEPEAYKLVTFEIHGPLNPYYNITIYRSAWTNESGIATINFTIPGSGFEHWEDMVFGHWTCYQACQVKIYTKLTDWLFFKVGWIIEITDVTVILPHPEGAEKGETIEIVIDYKTIMFIPKWVVFTVTILDELLDPIQWDAWGVQVAPCALDSEGNPILCSERADVTSTLSDIAIYAHVGLATVYVNAFTDIPWNCGCIYCPEVTETFFVIKTGSGT